MYDTYRRAHTNATLRKPRPRIGWNTRIPDGEEVDFNDPDEAAWFKTTSIFGYQLPSTVLVEEVASKDNVKVKGKAPAQARGWKRKGKVRFEGDVESEANSSGVVRRLELTTEGFWDFLFSDRWEDTCLLRVLQGELLDKLLTALYHLAKEHDVISYVTVVYIDNPIMIIPCMKNAAAEESYCGVEQVLVELDYFSPDLKRLAPAKAHQTHQASASSQNPPASSWPPSGFRFRLRRPTEESDESGVSTDCGGLGMLGMPSDASFSNMNGKRTSSSMDLKCNIRGIKRPPAHDSCYVPYHVVREPFMTRRRREGVVFPPLTLPGLPEAQVAPPTQKKKGRGDSMALSPKTSAWSLRGKSLRSGTLDSADQAKDKGASSAQKRFKDSVTEEDAYLGPKDEDEADIVFTDPFLEQSPALARRDSGLSACTLRGSEQGPGEVSADKTKSKKQPEQDSSDNEDDVSVKCTVDVVRAQRLHEDLAQMSGDLCLVSTQAAREEKRKRWVQNRLQNEVRKRQSSRVAGKCYGSRQPLGSAHVEAERPEDPPCAKIRRWEKVPTFLEFYQYLQEEEVNTDKRRKGKGGTWTELLGFTEEEEEAEREKDKEEAEKEQAERERGDVKKAEKAKTERKEQETKTRGKAADGPVIQHAHTRVMKAGKERTSENQTEGGDVNVARLAKDTIHQGRIVPSADDKERLRASRVHSRANQRLSALGPIRARVSQRLSTDSSIRPRVRKDPSTFSPGRPRVSERLSTDSPARSRTSHGPSAGRVLRGNSGVLDEEEVQKRAALGITYSGTQLLSDEQRQVVHQAGLIFSQCDPWHITVRFAYLAGGVCDSIGVRNALLRRRERIYRMIEDGKLILKLNEARLWSLVRAVPASRKVPLHISSDPKADVSTSSAQKKAARLKGDKPKQQQLFPDIKKKKSIRVEPAAQEAGRKKKVSTDDFLEDEEGDKKKEGKAEKGKKEDKEKKDIEKSKEKDKTCRAQNTADKLKNKKHKATKDADTKQTEEHDELKGKQPTHARDSLAGDSPPGKTAPAKLLEETGFQSIFDATKLKSSYSFEKIFSPKRSQMKNYDALLKKYKQPFSGKKKDPSATSLKTLSSRKPPAATTTAVTSTSSAPATEEEGMMEQEQPARSPPPMVLGKLRDFRFLKYRDHVSAPLTSFGGPPRNAMSMEEVRERLEQALKFFVVRKERATTTLQLQSRVSVTFTRRHVASASGLFMADARRVVAGLCRTLQPDPQLEAGLAPC